MKATVKRTNAKVKNNTNMNTNTDTQEGAIGSAAVSNSAEATGLIKKEVVNRVTLTGNLGGAPEIVELTNGMKKAKFRVATNRYFKNKQGEWQSETSWHNVIAWGKLAIQAQKNLEKGSPVSLDGKLSYRMFTDKEGVSRFYAEIVVSRLVALPKKEEVEQKMAA
jgi:single-strand DNA-binding protein